MVDYQLIVVVLHLPKFEFLQKFACFSQFIPREEMHMLERVVVLSFCLTASFIFGTLTKVTGQPSDNEPQRYSYDGPTVEEWEFPRAWSFRRQITRAVTSSECWPRAKFGLLQSTSGCPSGTWKTGTVRHALRPTSSVSSENYLKAEIAPDSVVLHFCMRDAELSDDREEFDCAGHDPSFPPGSYCIMNGQKPNVYERCPTGFHWSALGVDDVGVNGDGSRSAGQAPTGEFFGTFSHYYMCCRNDSSPSTPMTLPTSRAFILFPLNSEKSCQEIHGLRARMFSVFLDTETESYFGHPDKSNAPFAATEVVLDGGGSCSGDRYGKGLKLHLCYYSRW